MYSLIISADEDQWSHSPTEFDKRRYLEFTLPALAATYQMSHDVAKQLMALPTVFAYERGCGEVARIGRVSDLTWSSNTLRFGFSFDPSLPAMDLEQFFAARVQLNIGPAEPHRTHWAIKDVDLPNALEVAGLLTPDQAQSLRRRPRFTPIPLPPTPGRPGPAAAPAARPGGPAPGYPAPLPTPIPTLPVAVGPEARTREPAVASPLDMLATSVNAALRSTTDPGARTGPPRVFIVHGRDSGFKSEVALFLVRIGVEAIILHEQPNGGRTIFEKFGDVADTVDYAIVLMTPDDVGGLKGEAEQHARARQNVVLELGFFIGKLGKHRVCALKVGDIEIPSDLFGVLYIAAEQGDWKQQLARELLAANIPIDGNRALML